MYRFRPGRSAPSNSWTTSWMWGSASADRSILEPQGPVLRLGDRFGDRIESAPAEMQWAPALATGAPPASADGRPAHRRAPPPAPAGGGSASASAGTEGTLSVTDGLGRRARWLVHRAPRGSPTASAAGTSASAPFSGRERPARNRRESALRGGTRQRTCSRREPTAREPGQAGRRMDGNDRKATDAAMQKRLLTRGTLRRVTASRGPEGRRRTPRGVRAAPGNATNPTGRQRGATNPQSRRGASRRGGAKPRGRNESGPSRGRAEGSASFLEWTRRKTNGRGVQAGESHERQDPDLFGGRERVLAETRAL